MKINASHPSSFRDPSGNIFKKNGEIFRQVNKIYKDNFDFFVKSGLYEYLTDELLLVSHNEIKSKKISRSYVYKIIKPQQIPFISYPYEWSFSQLKHAALLSLKIQKIALEYEMSLKDCSAFNIQFFKGKPIFIDTLSFEKYNEGQPWVAYKQFCEFFLAPLALMTYKDCRLNILLQFYTNGISLDLVSKILPARSWIKFPLLSHIHLHAKSQNYFENKSFQTSKKRNLSKKSLLALISNLESSIGQLALQKKETQWSNYHNHTNYSFQAEQHKKYLVSKFLDKIKRKTMVWDLGANTGLFSRLAAKKSKLVISIDSDPATVEKNYLSTISEKEKNILPLIIDLTNPSPAIGWANCERMSLLERGPADVILSLALIHHLVIANNVPLIMVANFLHKLCNFLIIEFVPKSDSNVQRMLTTRQDIFEGYNIDNFEKYFRKYFKIIKSSKVKDSERFLYLMQSRKRLR